MWKILSKIFNPAKLGEAIISGVDKAFLTKEEQIDYFKDMLKLYEPYKLAQRILAIMFSGIFLLVHLMIAIDEQSLAEHNLWKSVYSEYPELKHKTLSVSGKEVFIKD